MPAAPTRVMSPEQWRTYLGAKMGERQPRLTLYDDYYRGDHRLAFATAKFKEAFGDLFNAFADNWCGLVVDVAVDRMKVEGFRFDGSTKNDTEAWNIWQANRLDAASLMAHTEAVKLECSYLMVGPPAKGEDVPKITVEHPSQVIVETDPADRSVRLAALKRYTDRYGNLVEVVYEPDQTTTFTHDGTLASVLTQQPNFFVPPGFSTAGARPSTEENPLGEVPVIALENNPDMLGGGVSDLRAAVSLNDAANKFFSDMIVASEFQAFRQRVLTGVEVPIDPATNQPITDIEMAVSRLMVFEGENAKAFDLQQGDLANYVQAIELAVQHLAAQTRTPPHYLLAKMVNLSGDALKAAEAGLVARVRRKHTDFSDSWEDGIRLAFKWRAWRRRNNGAAGMSSEADKDDERGEDMNAQTDWSNPETEATGLVADSLVKKQQVGWPTRMLFREGGMSEQDIRNAEQLLEEQAKKEGPSKEVIERIQMMHDGLGIPFETLWKKYLGFTDAEVREALKNSPLTGGSGTPPEGGNGNGNGPAATQRSARRRDAVSARPQGGRRDA